MVAFAPLADVRRSLHHARMVEIAGQSYEVVVGSDIQRDGMYLETRNEANEVIAEIFYSDQDGTMSFTGYLSDLPLPLVEWMISHAKARLTPEPGDGD